MPYITKSKLNAIIGATNIDNLKLDVKYLYKPKRPLDFFNRFEANRLLAFRLLCEDEEKFLTEVYTPLEIKDDTYTLVFEKMRHSYHRVNDCSTLNNQYLNFKIPVEIKREDESGWEIRVKDFRKWVKDHLHVYQRSKKDFFSQMFSDYHVTQISPDDMIVERDNTGHEDVENYDLETLEPLLDKVIGQAYWFFEERNIPSYFGKYAFLAKTPEKLPNGAPHPVVLEEFKSLYKEPITKLLKEWYMISLNPDLSFNGNVLEKLGFQSCWHCYREQAI